MPLKMYRYSDGNTYTDNLTLREAQRFVRLQNGGTITEMEHPRVSNPDLAALLRSMASALEHGRYASFRRKVGILWRIVAEWGELP